MQVLAGGPPYVQQAKHLQRATLPPSGCNYYIIYMIVKIRGEIPFLEHI